MCALTWDNGLVAKGYRRVDRDQRFLLAEDMRDWLPADDPVWLVIEAVELLDTSALHVKRKIGGVGRAGYDPDMLLALLIWGWAQGQRSSRRLERLCHRDVAFRIICAGDAPDHVTISRFRADCTDVVEDLFTQVLVLCAKVGLARLGVVALDGVKIGSDASLSANRTGEGLARALVEAEAAEQEKLRQRLAAQAAAASAEHAAVDSAEDELFADRADDRTPPELANPQSRAARIRAAIADLAGEDDKREQRRQAAARRAKEAEQATQNRRELLAQWRDKTRQRQQKGQPPWEIEVEIREEIYRRALAEEQARVDRWRPGARGMKPGPAEQHRRVRKARASWEKAVAQRQAREQAEQAAAATKAPAHKPARSAADLAPARRNTTDPQSRAMPLRGGGWVQGYNCQAATTEDGVIIATGVDNNPSDMVTFADMVAKADAAAQVVLRHRAATADRSEGDLSHCGTGSFGDPERWGIDDVDGGATTRIGLLLADAGYLSAENLTCPGPKRLIAPGKSKQVRDTARHTPAAGPPPVDGTATDRNAHRIATVEGASIYSRRSHIAETPFGHAKHNLNFRRFTSRGLDRAAAEFSFHAMVHNLLKAISTGNLRPALG